tara:strand:+ start:124 stop:1044 length:921 start_codon:yes stop_codon:yes gene_type:complete
MGISICGYCMLHRYKTFKKVINNIRSNAQLENIPFYSFSFKDSYNERTRIFLEQDIENLKINFIKKTIPDFIKEKDLFYNKTHIEYVRKSFPKERLNYLHMVDFVSDPSTIPFINNYDLAVQFDDDSWFKSKYHFEYESFYENSNKMILTSHTYINDTAKRRETKINFFQELLKYCKINKIIPKNKLLAQAIEKEDENLFNQLPWTSCNFNVYKTSMFNNQKWKDWITFIKSSGGIFTYRWGDQEIIGAYAYLFYEDPVIDLDLFPNIYTDKIDYQDIIIFKRNIIIKILSKLKRKLKMIIQKIIS